MRIYKHDPKQAQKLLNDFTTQTVSNAFNLVDDLINQIITEEGKLINSKYLFHGA